MQSQHKDRSVGNGDTCPVDPSHGHMMHLKSASDRQYCPHHDHEGRPERPGQPGLLRSRAFWPTGFSSFPAAVAEWEKPHG